MKKIPVREPKDIPEVKLPPLIIERVEVTKPDPPEVKVGWFELLYSLLRKGGEEDLNRMNRGERPLYWSSLIDLLRQDWWKLAAIIAVPLLIWAGVKIFG